MLSSAALGLFIIRSLGLIGGFRFRCFGGFCLGGNAGFLLGGDGGDFLVARQRRNFVDRRLIDQASRGFLDRGLGLGVEQAGRIRRFVVARQLDRVVRRSASCPCGPGPNP